MSLYGREHGVRLGGGGPVNEELLKLQRKERLRSLTAEVFDVKNDPYLLRNHLGTFECKLCFTLHRTLENYAIHTECKKHKDNLAKRIHRLNKDKQVVTTIDKKRVDVKQTPRIGRPGYQVFKQLHKETGAHSMLFRLQYPQIADGMRPRYRIVSAYEQKVVAPQDNAQYVVFAAEPYETVGFQIPNIPLDKDPAKFLTHWNAETCVFTLQLTLKDGFGTKYHKSAEGEMGVLDRAQTDAFAQVHAHAQSIMPTDQQGAQSYSTMDLWQSY